MQKDRLNMKCSVGRCVGNYSPRLDEKCPHVLGISNIVVGMPEGYSENDATFLGTGSLLVFSLSSVLVCLEKTIWLLQTTLISRNGY